jgi:hypothetical protein
VSGQAKAHGSFTSGSLQTTDLITIGAAVGNIVVGGAMVDVQFSSSFGTRHSWLPLHIVAHAPAGYWQAIFPALVQICSVVDGTLTCGRDSPQFGIWMKDQLPALQV